MRSDKKDIRKVRLNNLIFGTSTVTTACDVSIKTVQVK